MLYLYLGPGRLAVLERLLPNTVIISDRFHCTYVPFTYKVQACAIKVHNHMITMMTSY